MILKSCNLYSIVCYLAIAAALCFGPLMAKAADSQNNPAATAAVSHLLDGKRFKGPTGERGKKTHHEDVLVFQNGQFTSTMCFEYGFTGGPYTAWVDGDVIHFTAETLSSTHGKMNWKGTLQGDTMVVDYSWTKKRWLWTTYREYWFKGTLQP